MKKIFTLAAIAAVALSFTMTSCSKSAEDYAKEGVELMKERAEAVKAGDEAKVKEIDEKIKALEAEIKEKSDKDPEFKKAVEEATVNALNEAAK